VPAIAERAGISVGAVYRRFPDKDTVLRAVVERFIARSARLNARSLEPARWRGVPADVIARIFVVSVVRTYRLKAGLFKALEALARSHPDAAFRKRIEEFNLDSIRRVTELLLERRDELDHPDPAAGVRFCTLAIAAMSRFLSLSDGEAAKLLDLSDEHVEREMHRFFTRHLGIAEHPDGRRLAREYGQRLRRDIVEEALAAGEISAEAARSALAKPVTPTDDSGSSTAAKPRRVARKTPPSRSQTAQRRSRA
jgi:AcrR family transcriptional regulator